MTVTSLTDFELADVARHAAHSVGELILDAFGTGVAVEHKSSKFDPVTEVDRESERRITEFLRAATPHADVIGEEYGESGEGNSALRWHIDPIDGTHNFVAGVPYFCTSIAAEQDGRLVAGAIHDPVHGETFWASSSQAWVNDVPVAAATEFPGAPCVLTAQPFQGLTVRPEDLPAFLDLLKSFGIVRNPGSLALQIAHVAIGRAQAAIELAGAAPWDIAAGLALAQATGCTVVRLAPAPAGFGSWGSHSYLVVRDPEVATRIVPELTRVLERGTVPEIFSQ